MGLGRVYWQIWNKITQKEHFTNHFLTKWITNFYILLTVHLSIILGINQLNAQFLVLNKFIICLYTFRELCAHNQKAKTVLYSIWYHHSCRWPSVVTGGFWFAHGQSIRGQNLKKKWGAWASPFLGPGGKGTQTQKQDGVDGPKLKSQMASMGPNTK